VTDTARPSDQVPVGEILERTPLEELSEGEFFAMLRRRPGMYVGPTGIPAMASLLVGYDLHATRHGGPGLDGFRDWLIAKGAPTNLVFWAQVRRLLFPGRTGAWDQQLTAEEAVAEDDGMLRLLGEFIADRDGHEPIVVPTRKPHDPHVEISSLVLYTVQPEACRDFYAAFGLHFMTWNKVGWPTTYAALLPYGNVLEICPADGEAATGPIRLGLTINGAAAKPQLAAGHHEFTDPGGRIVAVFCSKVRSAV
jgi:hypothetical protein